jgi:hypothetical protein
MIAEAAVELIEVVTSRRRVSKDVLTRLSKTDPKIPALKLGHFCKASHETRPHRPTMVRIASPMQHFNIFFS